MRQAKRRGRFTVEDTQLANWNNKGPTGEYLSDYTRTGGPLTCVYSNLGGAFWKAASMDQVDIAEYIFDTIKNLARYEQKNLSQKDEAKPVEPSKRVIFEWEDDCHAAVHIDKRLSSYVLKDMKLIDGVNAVYNFDHSPYELSLHIGKCFDKKVVEKKLTELYLRHT